MGPPPENRRPPHSDPDRCRFADAQLQLSWAQWAWLKTRILELIHPDAWIFGTSRKRVTGHFVSSERPAWLGIDFLRGRSLKWRKHDRFIRFCLSRMTLSVFRRSRDQFYGRLNQPLSKLGADWKCACFGGDYLVFESGGEAEWVGKICKGGKEKGDYFCISHHLDGFIIVLHFNLKVSVTHRLSVWVWVSPHQNYIYHRRIRECETVCL